jgi:DNA-binding Lrp family transcriptional regulator
MAKMPTISYVLAQVAPARATEAARSVSRIPGVKKAYAVMGPFDLIAFVDLAALSNLALSRIQTLKGIEKTKNGIKWLQSPSQRRIEAEFREIAVWQTAIEDLI